MGEQAAWIRIQKKTFTRWCNNYLSQRDLEIGDLQTDLADGVKLHTLLEILGAEEVHPRVNRKAKMKLQKIENLNTCLRYVKSKNIKLVGIGAEDIHDGKLSLILGLIWTLILRFQIMEEDDEAASARQALLDWCNSVLNPQGLSVKNFTNSWCDGRAFCGLVNALEPDQIPLNEVPADTPIENMDRAFDDAEELFQFPQVLDAEDVVENPDDLSIMTYVSYFRAFMLANSAYAPNCYAEGPGLTEGVTGEDAPFTVYAVNEEGEQAVRGGAMVRATLKDGDTEVCKVNIKDNRDGTYSCTYNAPNPGTFELWIGISKKPIKDVPYHPVVRPGEPSPSMCEADGPGISEAVAGQPVQFRVITKDVNGKQLDKGGANIQAVLHDAQGDIEVAVVDNGDGTYSCEYTPQSTGTSVLDVNVITEQNGSGPIKDAPFSVNIEAGDFDLNNTLVEIPDPSQAGRPGPKVSVKDSLGNNRAGKGDSVEADLTPKLSINGVQAADNGDGTYTINYPPNLLPGPYDISIRVNGQDAPGAPFTADVGYNDLSDEHSAAVDSLAPNNSALLKRLLLGATDAERDALIAELSG